MTEIPFEGSTDYDLAEKDAKIAEQAGQIVALRERHLKIAALSAGWDEDGSIGPVDPLSWESVGRLALDYARAALSTPAPKVVPLEDVMPLVDALENLRDEQNGPPLERHKKHWQAAYDNANKVLAEFNSKHPL